MLKINVDKWIKDEESLVVERFLLEWSGSPRLKIPLERMAETIDFSAIRMFQRVNVLFSLLTSIDVSFLSCGSQTSVAYCM